MLLRRGAIPNDWAPLGHTGRRGGTNAGQSRKPPAVPCSAAKRRGGTGLLSIRASRPIFRRPSPRPSPRARRGPASAAAAAAAAAAGVRRPGLAWFPLLGSLPRYWVWLAGPGGAPHPHLSARSLRRRRSGSGLEETATAGPVRDGGLGSRLCVCD